MFEGVLASETRSPTGADLVKGSVWEQLGPMKLENGDGNGDDGVREGVPISVRSLYVDSSDNSEYFETL